MPSQRLTFTGAGGAKLAARLELPIDGPASAFALFAHCFTCSKNLRAVAHISRALCQEGVGVLRFDFTGLGESEGDFEDTTFSSNVGDLVAAAEFLERDFGPPAILIGHSFGGAAVLQAAARIPASGAVVTIGAPFEVEHVARHFASSLDEIEAHGAAEVVLAGRKFTITKEFVDDLNEQNMTEVVQKLGRSLLIFHSPVDSIVSIENAARIFKAAKHPKSFVSLDDADHLLEREDDSQYVARVIAAWASRYIETPLRPKPDKSHPGSRVVARIGASGYRTDILANGHPLVADEPLSVGGTDTGPSPYDLLLAALGACKTITLRMYADRKGWPLEEVTVALEHRKLHATDAEECEDRPAKLDEIRSGLHLVGPLEEAQRQRLAEIADRCPVHRTLDAGVQLVSKLENGALASGSAQH